MLKLCTHFDIHDNNKIPRHSVIELKPKVLNLIIS